VTFVIGHPGHWLVNVAYFLPVVAFLVWLAITQLRERRRQRAADGPSETANGPS
jgi:threonine/homoserine/homoserine lactone efflux protein